MLAEAEVRCSDVLATAQAFASLAAVLGEAPDGRSVGIIARMAEAADIAGPEVAPLPRLQIDHAQLFVVPGARYVAPYESVYRDAVDVPGATAARKVLVMGPATFDVRRAQAEAGMQPRRGMPDHVANELWLVAHLWRKQAHAGAGEQQAWARRRDDFIERHLRQWLPDLTAAVRRHEQCGVYSTALQVAAELLQA